MMYNINLGMDTQVIDHPITDIREITSILSEDEWCYFKSWDGSEVAIHSNYGKDITSINQVIEAKPDVEAAV